MKESRGWGNRQSLGNHKEDTSTVGTTNGKDHTYTQNENSSSKYKGDSEQTRETNEPISPNPNGVVSGNVDITVQS